MNVQGTVAVNVNCKNYGWIGSFVSSKKNHGPICKLHFGHWTSPYPNTVTDGFKWSTNVTPLVCIWYGGNMAYGKTVWLLRGWHVGGYCGTQVDTSTHMGRFAIFHVLTSKQKEVVIQFWWQTTQTEMWLRLQWRRSSCLHTCQLGCGQTGHVIWIR